MASIVRGCSDSVTESEEKKADWGLRKDAHPVHLKDATMEILIVKAADKLHSARAIATDFHPIGDEVWKRFNKKTIRI